MSCIVNLVCFAHVLLVCETDALFRPLGAPQVLPNLALTCHVRGRLSNSDIELQTYVPWLFALCHIGFADHERVREKAEGESWWNDRMYR